MGRSFGPEDDERIHAAQSRDFENWRRAQAGLPPLSEEVNAMSIVFSKDYRGPGFGFLTQARSYDKGFHFAGSAAGVVAVLVFGRLVLRLPAWFVYGTPIPLWIASAIVFAVGLGLEIYQGRKRYLWENPPEEGPIGVLPTNYDPSDGFSFLDLVADLAGIALVWGLL